MINNFKDSETRDSAIIYKSTWEQIKMLHAQDKEKAGELAISAIEMMLTGELSTDDVMIQIILKDMETISANNKNKHEKSKEAKREARMHNLKLDTIAEMLRDGNTQKAIAAALGETAQTISNRVKVIREDFPELLQDAENQKNQVNQKDVNDNVNVNVNVNDNVTAASPCGGGSPRSPMLGAGAPAHNSLIDKGWEELTEWEKEEKIIKHIGF